MDNFSQSLIEKTTTVRKSGLTFAAEAGTPRLRNVINKNVTWDEIEKTCTIAFNAGYTSDVYKRQACDPADALGLSS